MTAARPLGGRGEEDNMLVDWVWRRVLRPLAFRFDPEWSHDFTQWIFPGLMRFPGVRRLTTRHLRVEDPRLRVRRFGLEFPNPVGLAAGLDKNAEWFGSLQALGFGFLEVGTLTAQAQMGKPKIRVFRLPADRALLNRMGSPNKGAAAAAARLARHPRLPILGINIGKTASVPNESAPLDYLTSFEQLYPYASYFALNISSPNTPGLRDLQARESLSVLLRALMERNGALARSRQAEPKPLLVKIAPDLDDRQLDDLISLCAELRVDGIIVANSTTGREGLSMPDADVRALGEGGLSGAPLTQRARALVAAVYRKTRGAVPIIGVGGIMTGEDAWQMIRAGASLVQVHSGFIYGGPGFVASINRHLLHRLSEVGKASIEEVIGEASRTPAAENLQRETGPPRLVPEST
jgi:dihydroorotate dehydrogenase